MGSRAASAKKPHFHSAVFAWFVVPYYIHGVITWEQGLVLAEWHDKPAEKSSAAVRFVSQKKLYQAWEDAMDDKEKTHGPGHEVIERTVQERVTQARKEEVLEIYNDLLKTIWNRILPTLGRVTVMAIMERALAITEETYPLIGYLQVTSEGVSFRGLSQNVKDEDTHVIREGLKELVANLIDILAMLTGDILVKQLLQEIEGRKQ